MGYCDKDVNHESIRETWVKRGRRSYHHPASLFTDRETEAQGGQSWALEMGLLSLELTSPRVQTSDFFFFYTHLLAMELNWPCFSISELSPLFRLGGIQVCILICQSCPTLCNPMSYSPLGFSCPRNFSGKNAG